MAKNSEKVEAPEETGDRFFFRPKTGSTPSELAKEFGKWWHKMREEAGYTDADIVRDEDGD